MDFCSGKSWGGYEIISRIAVGGMAEVYRARRRGSAGFCKEVALKRMRPEFAGRSEFRRMFEREAWIAARLNHPNLAQAFDLIDESGELALAMEFVSGCSLRRLTAAARGGRGLCPESRTNALWMAAHIAWSAAEALDHAWNARDESGAPLRLIHRDVSPHNLLLSRMGTVKLIDFGIARPLGEESDAGVVKGKLRYMAPEQIVGGQLDARTDLFSLGIVLYESALGLSRPLFDAESESRARAALLEREIVAPSRIDEAFPEELSALIMKALERDPARRFDSARSMARALKSLIERHWRGESLSELIAQAVCRHLREIRGRAAILSRPREVAPRARPREGDCSGQTELGRRERGCRTSGALSAVKTATRPGRLRGQAAVGDERADGQKVAVGGVPKNAPWTASRPVTPLPAPPEQPARASPAAGESLAEAVSWIGARQPTRSTQPVQSLQFRRKVAALRRQTRRPRSRWCDAGMRWPKTSRAGLASLVPRVLSRRAPYLVALLALIASCWSLLDAMRLRSRPEDPSSWEVIADGRDALCLLDAPPSQVSAAERLAVSDVTSHPESARTGDGFSLASAPGRTWGAPSDAGVDATELPWCEDA